MRVIKEKFESGFTLIETLVALVIISVSLLSLGAFTITVLSTDNVAIQRHIATNVGVEKLEAWPGVATGTTVRNNVSYTWVTTTNNAGISGLNGGPVTRTVTVSWSNKGIARQMVLNGMVLAP